MEPVSRRASGPEVRLEKKLSAGAVAAVKARLLVVPSRVPCEVRHSHTLPGLDQVCIHIHAWALRQCNPR